MSLGGLGLQSAHQPPAVTVIICVLYVADVGSRMTGVALALAATAMKSCPTCGVVPPAYMTCSEVMLLLFLKVISFLKSVAVLEASSG